MARQTRPPKGLLAQRLDYLFRTIHPKDRGPYTPAEVADAINAAAGGRVVSATYLWLLRTGERDNPTLRHLTAIANFFGVPPVYFLPDTGTDDTALHAEVVAALTDDKVRDLTLRAAGLSDRSLQAIADMVDSARSVEGLAALGFALPSTLADRMTRCGHANCRCHADPPRLHGPYHQWTRKKNGKTATRILSEDQFADYGPWFDSHRRLRELVAELEELSLAIAENDPRWNR
jgi:ESX-1-secreted protein regulator